MSGLLAPLIAEVNDRIQSTNWVSLFLDFDGTLVPIATDPTKPELDRDVAETLKLIAAREWLVTTIISGRSIEDLYRRIRLEGLIYAGNYGMEISGRNLSFVEPLAWERREQLQMLCGEVGAELQAVAGALVECKGVTASVHYRLAAKADVPHIQAAVQAAVARNGAQFRMSAGRKVFEILPRTDWHKGAAVRWINGHLGERPELSIYLGDDTCDEDAFSVLPGGITVKVGGAPVTCARYRLPDPAAVHEFLGWLAARQSSRVHRA